MIMGFSPPYYLPPRRLLPLRKYSWLGNNSECTRYEHPREQPETIEPVTTFRGQSEENGHRIHARKEEGFSSGSTLQQKRSSKENVRPQSLDCVNWIIPHFFSSTVHNPSQLMAYSVTLVDWWSIELVRSSFPMGKNIIQAGFSIFH